MMIGLEEFVNQWDIYITEQSTKLKGGFSTFFNTLDDCIEYMDENPDTFSKYGITKEILSSLYEIANGQPPFTINPKTNEIKLRRFFIRDEEKKSAISKLGKFIKGESIKFKIGNAPKEMIIGDGGLSIRAKSGSGTEPQELLTCDFIMNDNLDVDKKVEEYGLDKGFKISVVEQIKKLKKFIGTSDLSVYEALRPANASKDPLIKELNRIYKMKKLFNGAATNIITPADIYLVLRKDKEDVVNLLKTIDKDDKLLFTECKAIFLKLITEKKLIPVSLKKIVKKDNENEPVVLNTEKINLDIKKEFTSSITDNGIMLKFNIDGHTCKMNYRSNQEHAHSFTFEFNTVGNGGADGKAKTYLNIVFDEYNIVIPTTKTYYAELDNKDYSWYVSFWKEHTQNLSVPNIEIKKPDENMMNSDKAKYSFINICLFIDLLNKIWKKGEEEFYSFVGTSYLFCKKVTNNSLPYLLIK